MNRYVAMNELVDDIKSFASAISPKKTFTPIYQKRWSSRKRSSDMCRIARTAIPDTWSTKTKTSSSS